MNVEARTIPVPDALGGSVTGVEALYALTNRNPLASGHVRYVLDMAGVSFVRPYGAVALLIAARRLSVASGRPVELANLRHQVHLYLERMNLFEVGEEWLRPARSSAGGWDRNPQTPNLLELTAVRDADDVVAAISRAELVFSRWLAMPNLNDLLRVLSELCANVHQHSGDPQGCVMIQKYEEVARERTIVCVAVGDLGCGVRGSLAHRHGEEVGREPLDYLCDAMSGRTSRPNARGGLGLRRTEEIASDTGGHLWLRSETAGVLSRGSGPTHRRRGLPDIPGTQVAVELHAPLRN